MTTPNRHRFSALLCGLTLSLLSGVSLAATNLLTNPSFDGSLAGWTLLSPSTASWSTVDAHGNGNSGSALVANEMHPSNGFVPLVLGAMRERRPVDRLRVRRAIAEPGRTTCGYRTAAVAQCCMQPATARGTPMQTLQEHPPTIGEWVTIARGVTTPASVHSIRIALGVVKPEGVTAVGATYDDDLFLRPGTGGLPFVLGPSMSASWYNPAQSGHGITLELLEGARAWMCWFTFDLAGSRAWICGQGTSAASPSLSPMRSPSKAAIFRQRSIRARSCTCRGVASPSPSPGATTRR